VKLLQIDGHQNEVENDDRIYVREKAIQDEQDIACESCHAKIPNRVHAKARQNGSCSRKTKQV
jgi:hypothetical protein